MKISDKVFEYIDALAEKLGVAAEHVYGAMLRQVIIEGVVFSVLWILAVIAMLTGLYVCGKWVLEVKKRVDNDEDYEDWDDHFGGLTAVAMVSCLLVILVFCFAGELATNVMKLSNPEYYVIQEILSVFK